MSLEDENKKLKEKYDSTLKINNFQNNNIAELRRSIDEKQNKIEEVCKFWILMLITDV